MSWRFLTRNFGWKLGSLLLSMVLWFAIVGEPELATTHSVPILYKNLPAGLLIGAEAVDAVRVELRGPASRLTPTKLADLTVLLDLSNLDRSGERTFTLTDSDLHLPEGVTFLRAVPSQIRVVFSRRKEKEIPVEVRVAQPPPSGYEVVKREVFPAGLQIVGPEHRIDAISSAQTDALDLSSVTETSDVRVNAFLPDPQVWFQSSPLVTVRVTIEKRGTKDK